MYAGDIQSWIDNEIKYVYDNLSTQDLIAKYLEVLDYVNQPLYAFQVNKMKTILENIEKHIDDDIYDDLINLRDKDLIIKYDLEPKIISIKYHGINLDEVKASNKTEHVIRASDKTEHIYKKENFIKQYKLYIEKFGDKYQ